MAAEPRLLLDASITYLQRLAHAFADEMGSHRPPGSSGPDAKVCKELLLSISILLPKLQAARYLISRNDVPAGEQPRDPSVYSCGPRATVEDPSGKS